MGGVLDPSRDCAFTGTIDGNKIQVSTLGGSIGYAGTGGAGGAVTQLTNKSPAVTLNAICGAITTSNASLANATAGGFTLTNKQIAPAFSPRSEKHTAELQSPHHLSYP